MVLACKSLQCSLASGTNAVPIQARATARVAIDDLFLENVDALGEQAIRSVDTLAQRALYDMYMGGNTRVTTTLGSAAITVKVDDVRGLFMTMNSQDVPVSVSNTAILTVVVGSNRYEHAQTI